MRWFHVAPVVVVASLVGVIIVTLSSSGTAPEAVAAPDMVAAFNEWHADWKQTSERSADMQARGVLLAGARRVVLSNLIRTDPEAALAQAVLPEERSDLPEPVTFLLEEFVSGKATVDGVASMPAAGYSPEEHFTVYFGARFYEAHTYGRLAGRIIKSPVYMWGIVLDGHAAISESPLRPVPASAVAETERDPISGAPASGALGGEYAGTVHYFASQETMDKYTAMLIERSKEVMKTDAFLNSATRLTREITTLIMIVQFADEAAPPTTPASFTQIITRANTFWQDCSAGCAKFVPVFTAPIQLGVKSTYNGGGACPISNTNAKNSPLDNDAWAKATQQGYTEANFDRYVIVFTQYSECAWLGLGSIAAAAVWVNGQWDPIADWHVTTHELGHNFGLAHANLWATPDQSSPNGANGATVPYGDNFDMMGGIYLTYDHRFFSVNARKKWGLTWIADTDVWTVDTATCGTAPCIRRIYAHDNIDASGARIIKYRVGGAGTTYYWMEYRAAMDYPGSKDFFDNGVAMYIISDSGDPTSPEVVTNLMDMTAPYTDSTGFTNATNDAPLQIGAVWADGASPLVVTPLLKGTATNGQKYLEVAIYLGTKAGAPAAPTNLQVTCGTPGVRDVVVFTASNVVGQVLSWDFGDGSYGHGAQTSHAYQWAGAFTVKVRAANLQGGVSDAATTTINVGASTGYCPCTATCQNGGVCGSGSCICPDGFMGASCETAISVALSGSNTFAVGAAVGVTFTGVTTLDVAHTVCRFHGSGDVMATSVSGQAVTCTVPAAASLLTANELDVSPDDGYHFTNSGQRVYFYQGALPTGNCSNGNGTYNIDGSCICNAGRGGPTCAVVLDADNITTLNYGPTSGNQLLTILMKTPLPTTNRGGCRDTVVVFTHPTNAFEPIMVSATVIGNAITCLTPEVPVAGAVTVQVSPNRGDSVSDSLTYTYIGIVDLFDGEPQTVTSADGSYIWYRMFVGDSTVDLSITATGNFDKPNSLYSSTGKAGYQPNACATSTVDFVCDLTSAISLSASDGKVAVGTYIVAVKGTASQQYTVKMATPIDAKITVQANATGSQTGFAIQTPRTFLYTHSGIEDGYASIVEVAEFSSGNPVTLSVTSASGVSYPITNTGSVASSILQSCAESGVYSLMVSGSNQKYKIKVTKYLPPVRDGEVDGNRTLKSITLFWPPTMDVQTGNNVTYYVFYGPAVTDASFNTSCGARAAGQQFGDVLTYDITTATVTGLTQATPYSFSVIARNSYGVEASFRGAVFRTRPTPIPLAIFYIVGAVAVAIVLMATILLVCLKCHKSRRRRVARAKLGPQAVVLKRKAKVLKDFNPEHATELKVAKGDIIITIGSVNKKGWIAAMNRERKKGLVPYTYLRFQDSGKSGASTSAASSTKSNSSKSNKSRK